MPSIATEYACPTCQQQSGAKSQINAQDGRIVCSVNSSHVWVDSQEFASLRPKMEFAVAQPAPAPQQGHTKWQVNLYLPMSHREAVEAKLGPKLEPTLSGIVSMLAEGDVMLIPSGDLQRLKQIPSIGKVPQSSGELVGMVYAADLQTAEAKDNERRALEEVAAYEGRNRNLIIIDLGEHREAAMMRAKDSNMPLKVWVETQMRNGIAENWF